MHARLLNFWIATIAIFASPAFAQYPGISDLGMQDSYQDLDDHDSQQEPESVEQNALSLENDSDLDSTQVSMREDFNYGFALGLGSGLPWLEYYLEALYIWQPNIWFTYFNGVGDSEFNGTSKTLKYSIDADQKVLGVSGRWYFWDIVPFYWDASLSFCMWDGNISPQGPVTLGSTPTVSIIRSGFDAHGIVMATGVGLSYIWENGVFIDYKLVGVLRSFVTKLDMHDPGSLSRDSIKNNFNKAYEFGIFNLKVGYILK